jgi:hypothetical protein
MVRKLKPFGGHRLGPSVSIAPSLQVDFDNISRGNPGFYMVLYCFICTICGKYMGSGEEVWKSSLDFVILAKGQLSVTSVQKFFDIILGPSTGFFLPELYHETLQEL